METIKFDRSCLAHVENCGRNKAFLDVRKQYLVEKLLYRGYIYLNEIYESFGAGWDPTRENICWHGKPLFVKTEQTGENEFTITVE